MKQSIYLRSRHSSFKPRLLRLLPIIFQRSNNPLRRFSRIFVQQVEEVVYVFHPDSTRFLVLKERFSNSELQKRRYNGFG